MTEIDWSEVDKECIRLCKAINQISGIESMSSCCGHGESPYHIFFVADSLDALPNLLYWFDPCHCGLYGWQVIVRTDCGKRPPYFMIEGPIGAHAEADEIAKIIELEELGLEEGRANPPPPLSPA